jgi:serine/threonine protein kinase
MRIPLGECSDEQLLAEVARRNLDLHDKITDAMVRETYEMGKILGHGASGQVYLATHRITGKKFACKVVKKNSSMNDAQSMSTEIEIMKRVRHRHIVSMYELYETPKCLWIILEVAKSFFILIT